MSSAPLSDPVEQSGELLPLFRPDATVLVGASRATGKLGAVMGRALENYGHALGKVNARNPDPASGLYPTATAAAEALETTFDLAVLCVPAAACADALADAAGSGVRAAVVCAGGFSEAGDRGVGYERALRDVADRTGIRVLGPNTSGFFAPALGLHASFVPAVADIRPGPVAVVAASGGINHALAFLLADAGVGVSLGVGLGIGFDVCAADVLEHLEEDEATRVIALHVESVSDGERLLAAVDRLTRTKPVVALVVGRNDVEEFARSHTGALATSWRTTRAVLRQAGAVVVTDERELVDAVTALGAWRLPPTAEPATGIVTAQAGPGLLLMDRLRGGGVAVPPLAPETRERLSAFLPPMTFQGNPVDTGRPSGDFARVMAAVGNDPGLDALTVYALEEPDSVDLERAFEDARRGHPRPTIAAIGGAGQGTERTRQALRETGIPVYATPTGAAVGTWALAEDARSAYRRAAAPDDAATDPVQLGTRGDSWDEDRAKDLVERLGLRTPDRRVCGSDEDAHRALDDLGGPLAVKILDASVLHKTDIGGVHLGVRTHDELDAALEDLRGIGADRVLLESMAPAGVDLLVGARRDPVFGPVVLLGLGGTMAEAIEDVTLRAAPLSSAEAASMIADLAIAEVLEGSRGGPVVDGPELAAVLRALGDLVVRTPSLEEIEVNPLRSTHGGLVALDAVVVVQEEERQW